MQRDRAQYVVEIDLDPVPGFNNEPDDMRRHLQQYLTGVIPHYNPSVVLKQPLIPAAVVAETQAFVDRVLGNLSPEHMDQA